MIGASLQGICHTPVSVATKEFLGIRDRNHLDSCSKLFYSHKNQLFEKAQNACKSGNAALLPPIHCLTQSQVRELDFIKILKNPDNKHFVSLARDYLRAGAAYHLSLESLQDKDLFPIGLTAKILGEQYCQTFDFTSSLVKRLGAEDNADPRLCFFTYLRHYKPLPRQISLEVLEPAKKDDYECPSAFFHKSLQEDKKFMQACKKASGIKEDPPSAKKDPLAIRPAKKLRRAYTLGSPTSLALPDVPFFV